MKIDRSSVVIANTARFPRCRVGHALDKPPVFQLAKCFIGTGPRTPKLCRPAALRGSIPESGHDN